MNASGQQPLDLGAAPDSEANLRTAYAKVPYLAKEGITFEQVLADPLMKKLLANINIASLRARAGALRKGSLAMIGPLAPPPISEDGFIVAIILAVLAGGVIGCILVLLRRNNGPR
jgi:hypothetical protein